jgi:hypothetical protein
LTKAEVKELQDQATRYLKEEICRVDSWVVLLADSEAILKRIEKLSALDSSPFTRQQLDNLRRRFEDYFHHGDYFEGKVWVKKHRPIFNNSNARFFTCVRLYLVRVLTNAVSENWAKTAALIRKKIARSDGIPLRFREVPHSTREDCVWDFWWIEDENENDDYPKWLIPWLTFGRLYSFKMYKTPWSERVVDVCL